MANDTLNIPRQNSYSATLTQTLDASATALTIYVDTVPVTTIPSGVYLEMTINPKKDFTKQEVVLVESIDSSASTLTVKSAGRAQDRYRGDSPTALSHTVGSTITLSNPYSLWIDIEAAIEAKATLSGGTFTGELKFTTDSATALFRVPNMTTAIRDTIGTPANGMLIYNTTTGTFQIYDGGTWQSIDTGATTPNASETVAGIIELATNAEMGTGTSTGGTGARLVAPNDQLVKASSGSGDENKIALLNASGQFASGFIAEPASSTASEKFIKQFTAGETVDGSTTPQAVYISDGTNGNTSGRFYKADADDTTNMAVRFFGFVDVNAASAGTNYNVTYGGVVGGFTGLTVGTEYYLSPTAGSITTSVSANDAAVPIGLAVSATQIYILPQTKSIYATYSFTSANSENVNTELLIGFRPSWVICWFSSGAWASTPTGVDDIGSTGFWHAGLGTGSGAGRSMAIQGGSTAGGQFGAMLGQVNSAPSTNSSEYLYVQAVSKDSITIKRIGGSSVGAVAMQVHLLISA